MNIQTRCHPISNEMATALYQSRYHVGHMYPTLKESIREKRGKHVWRKVTG